MKNKEVQEQRMRGYFIQATKDMLKGEGLKSISVRSIADRAGYSYTTMYSYFKDVSDLIFLCVNDFYEECRQHVKDQTKKREKGIKSLKFAIKAYADFFIQYPGIFELFFIEKIENFKDKKAIVDQINFSLDRICEEEWNYCVAKGIIRAENVELIKSQIRHMVLGLLLLYLNRRMPPSYTEFANQLSIQLNAIIDPVAPEKGTINSSGNMAVKNSLISINIGNNK
jgi:AcrR family transcriptional regulator